MITTLAQIAQIDGVSDLGRALLDSDVVIHAAARVHVMQDSSIGPLASFCKVIVEGTLNLARQAAKSGVRRLIFISSIKVNGEETSFGALRTVSVEPAPAEPIWYFQDRGGKRLMRVAFVSGMEMVIIRFYSFMVLELKPAF